MRESRRLIRAAREQPERCSTPTAASACSASASCCRCSGAAAAPAPPVDVARTIEDVLTIAPLDFVHVHEPFAPSAASVALRHSRALNVGSFHAPDRAGALDAGRAPVRRAVLRPPRRPHGALRGHRGADAALLPRRLRAAARPARRPRRARAATTGRCGSCSSTARSAPALRLFLRALRRLARGPRRGRRPSFSRDRRGADAALRSLRDRVRVSADDATEATALAGADVVVAASLGQRHRPRRCSCARSAPAPCPSPRGCRSTRRCSRDGELGLLFEPGDVDVLAAPARAPRRATPTCAPSCASGAAAPPSDLTWSARRRRGRGDLRRARRAAATTRPASPRSRARLAKRQLIDVDLHMHTDHSNDCATPVEVLLATARERRPRRDRGHRPQRDLRRARRAREGRRVRRQGDRRRGGQDRRPGRGDRPLHRGEDPARDDAGGDDRRDPPPGRARLRPAPVRPHALGARLRAPARASSTTSTRSRSSTRASRSPAFNEEAVRFAAKYRIVGGAGSRLPRRRRASARCASACATSTGPRSSSSRCATPTSPASPSSLRYAQVQALKFLQTQGHPAGRPRGHPPAQGRPRRRRPRRAMTDAGARRTAATRLNPVGGMPATDDEIREKYLERAIRELNHFTRDLQACDRCPRGNLMPVLGSGHPQADVLLLKYAPDAGGGRGGRRVLRPRRDRADEVAQAARHRSARRLRDAVREVPGRRHRRSPRRSASRGWSRRSRSCSRRSSW